MRDRILSRSIAALVGLALLSFVYLGSFSRMIGDDFQTAAIGIQYGAIGGMVERYQNWTGLYTNFLIKSAIAPYQVTLQPFITGAILALWLPPLWWFFAEFGLWLGWRQPRRFALWGTGLLAFTLFNSLSSRQPLYWFAAQIPYLLPIVPLTLWAALLLWLLRAERSRFQVMLGGGVLVALMFINGGFSEVIVTGQLGIIGLLWLAATWYRWRGSTQFQRAWWLLFLSGVVTGIALAVILLSPGNQTRQDFTLQAADYQAPPLPQLLIFILVYAARYFIADLYGTANIGFIGLATTALFFWWYKQHPDELKALPVPRSLIGSNLLALVATYGIIIAVITPSMYGAGVPGPRTLMLARLAQLAWMCFVGYSVAIRLAKYVPPFFWQRRLVYRLVKWAVIGLLLFMPLAVLGMHGALAPQFAAFAHGWDERHTAIQTQIEQGATEIYLAPLPYDLEDYLDLETLGTRDKPNWVNPFLLMYYGVPIYAEATEVAP